MRTLKKAFFGFLLATGVGMANAQATPPGGWVPDSLANRATQFCLNDGTRTLAQMVPQDGNCAAWQIGGALAAWYSNDAELRRILATKTQRDWALYAIKSACVGGDVANQVAIRLIQACNCHSISSQDAIENNQTEVLQVLKIRSEGHKAYPGCGDYPPLYGRESR